MVAFAGAMAVGPYIFGSPDRDGGPRRPAANTELLTTVVPFAGAGGFFVVAGAILLSRRKQ
jgi:hypothetical protein